MMGQPPRRLGLPERKWTIPSRRAQIAVSAQLPVYLRVQQGRAERFVGGWIALWWGAGGAS